MDYSQSIGIIGYGEVGKVFTEGLRQNQDLKIHVYDVLTQQGREDILMDIKRQGAIPEMSIRDLVHAADTIFVLVNSSAISDVIASIIEAMEKPIIVIDFTTSSPHTKQNCSNRLQNEHCEAVYIDAAIMGTVATEGFQVPILFASHNEDAMSTIKNNLQMNVSILVEQVGTAASIKLIRSVFMKGLEALVLESMTAAKKYNVENNVLESISTTLNNNDFKHFAEALIKTHVIHKMRRYKEVIDSMKLLEDANIEPYVSEGVRSFFEYSVKKEIRNTDSVDEILMAYGGK
ncbi:NAD(P)-binding domain-containing protein [Ureibacillus sp. GCM10028918]|uniref:NAD(P)-binding domain-containing protein n=1 Tax=Ureibacillus sp. GCM10028918 TaxID=3273429 RepID=UPI00360E9147